MCAQDCAYCRYKQERYRYGFSKPCFEWFREKKISKPCSGCAYYLKLKETDLALPADPSHPK